MTKETVVTDVEGKEVDLADMVSSTPISPGITRVLIKKGDEYIERDVKTFDLLYATGTI